jgi:glycosyltransferase involved in cell wall biosynthesis
LFVKEVFPKACLLNYCEFYYHGHGADLGFDPEFPLRLDAICQAHARNAHLLLALVTSDHGISPTLWQKSLHPPDLQGKISVVFDGIDTDLIRPARDAEFPLPSGIVLTRSNQVVTYTARNLEPYRGFHCFMRALSAILDACPNAQIVIVGGDDVSYGNAPSDGRTWREVMVQEVGSLDLARVHFLTMLAYGDYLRLLQVSQVHVYLTIPFVLSWSCMEALAAGCLVVGSQTPPVQEVIQDNENGLLVDFFSPAKIALKVIEALGRGDELDHIRQRARLGVMERYSLRECLTKQIDLVRSLV